MTPQLPATRPHLSESAAPSLSRLLVGLALLVVLLAASGRAEAPNWLLARSDGSPIVLEALDDLLPSPKEVLGHALGERFSRHEEIVGYLERLASSSDRVALWEYGRTYEDRPLVMAAISSSENIARLEELRERQVALAELSLSGSPSSEIDIGDFPICLWLAYGIHGNEASSAETAMAVAYVLAASRGTLASALEEAIILIDPLANPDGRERYVHWFETMSGREPDPYHGAAEHREPWPGGRQNHYLVDLNRDWAWLTQLETRSRLREYRRWEPHVYVDFHEMSSRSTYFFPPSAEPILSAIEPSTVGWLEVFGSANARAFDELGWTYYVGEKFDLFYPGYSDSYPSLRGAVGMTYEMAGHGRAGLAIERRDGSLLTLSDRIARHLTTTLTTVRTAVANRPEILADFTASRQRLSAGPGQTYLWRTDQAEAGPAADLLTEHGLSVQRLSEAKTVEVRRLAGGTAQRQMFAAGTYVLSTAQPLGALARSLMELDSPMSAAFLSEQRSRLEQNRSTEFFDITAWSIPLAYNLEAYVADGSVQGTTELKRSAPRIRREGDFGYLIPPQGMASHRLAAALLANDIRVRLTLSALRQGSHDYPGGTLFVPTRGNPAALEQRLSELAELTGVEISRTDSGFADSGVSLGSDQVVPLREPRIGLVGGAGTSPTSFGFVWFLLDQLLRVPYSRLDIATFDRVALADFDILVLPSGGGYSSRLDEELADEIERWVEDGGILIAIGSSISWLQSHELTDIEEWQAPEGQDGPNDVVALTPDQRALDTPGAALGTVVREDHPLAVGLDRPPAMLFRGRTILLATGDPRKDLVLAADEHPVVAGFAWPEAEERLRGTLLVGIEQRKGGAVLLFPQDPFFRLFWRAGATPFLNALLYAPSLNESSRLFE